MTYDQVQEEQKVIDTSHPEWGEGTVMTKLKTLVKVLYPAHSIYLASYNCFSVSSLEEVA